MLEKMLALQNKRKKEGGFTLVELIVVLVILAILAALLIPALTGYIDKAKDKSIIAETRQCVMAAQTLADEAYGKVQAGASVTVTPADVKKLAEVKGTVSDISGTLSFFIPKILKIFQFPVTTPPPLRYSSGYCQDLCAKMWYCQDLCAKMFAELG